VWGDKIDEYAIRENDAVEVSIDIESREFNGRWYTDVKAWKVVKEGRSGPAADESMAPLPPMPPEPASDEDAVDDLPF
jgi:hypothetical protein